AIKELFELLHAGDINLRQVFDAVPFRISFHNPKGTQMSEMELRPLTEAKRGGIVTRIMKKVTGRT
ncbi:MAG TPA: hypothetical protein VFM52_05030, partial [Rhodanobacter sp.]|nr:hypothetical protein [Rhodanobacter sp.]